MLVPAASFSRISCADGGDYSARRIALYTESQCDETSSSALAVVRAATSSPLITFSTSVRRASRSRSLLSRLASSGQVPRYRCSRSFDLPSAIVAVFHLTTFARGGSRLAPSPRDLVALAGQVVHL